MAARCLMVILLCCPTIVVGQVTGRFFLQKDTFAPGEPVFLYFEATNSGTETQNVYRVDPYSFCSGYQIKVSTDPAPTSSCAPLGGGGSCFSSYAPLEPGQSRAERILLNYNHKIGADGSYDVQAAQTLSYAPAGQVYFSAAKTSLVVRQQLHFRVDSSASLDDITLESWVEMLRSADPPTRREAARTLASLAPKSLEDLLMGFADNVEFREWAPLAFHRLNTSRSIAALAALLHKAELGTYEHSMSAEFLAETGDPQWFPVLLEVAQRDMKNGNSVYDAAESGEDKMLPVLLPLLHGTDEDSRQIAISALAYTGSPAAIPILLNLLRHADSETAERAVYGLRLLTHRIITSVNSSDNQQWQYPRWSQWWAREGSRAHIFKAAECGEFTPLD